VLENFICDISLKYVVSVIGEVLCHSGNSSLL